MDKEKNRIKIDLSALELIAVGFAFGASAEFGRILLLKLLAG